MNWLLNYIHAVIYMFSNWDNCGYIIEVELEIVAYVGLLFCKITVLFKQT